MDLQQIRDKLVEGVRTNAYADAIRSLAVFGSYVRGEAGADSDVDVLVRFTDDAKIGFFEYVRIQRGLSEAGGQRVDMVTEAALSKYIRDRGLREAQVVYQR